MKSRSMVISGEVSVPVVPSPLEERVDEALALEALHGHLSRQRATRRAGAKGLAGYFPVAVGRAFEVGDEDIVRSTQGGRDKGGEANEDCS